MILTVEGIWNNYLEAVPGGNRTEALTRSCISSSDHGLFAACNALFCWATNCFASEIHRKKRLANGSVSTSMPYV